MRLPTRAAPWPLIALASFWLALGYVHLAPGAPHATVRYRRWAFEHHAYSDLLAMSGDRYFHGTRPVPYLDDPIEYPPLLGLALWLPSFVPGGPRAYFTVGYGFLAACGLIAVLLLTRLPGTAAWWLAASPALAYDGGLNWDLLPIALMLGAVLALQHGRAVAAGALVALGASAKLWPVALVPSALGALGRTGRRAALLRGGLAATATWLAVNLPVLAVAPAAWGWFWRLNAARVAENSLWEAARLVPGLERLATEAVYPDVATVGALGVASGLAAWSAWRSGASQGPGSLGAEVGGLGPGPARATRLGVALVVASWITFNKVWSPQYALWGCAAGALAAAPGWLFALHALATAADYHVAFEMRAVRHLVEWLDPLYVAVEAFRTLVHALLAGWIGRELWRAARDGRPTHG